MENNWAIVIGINDYQHHPERQLQYAVADAEMMRSFLCEHGKFKPEQVILCIGKADQATQENYPSSDKLLVLLSRELTPEKINSKIDRFWFFFAGHGITKNGHHYLITTNSFIEDNGLQHSLEVSKVIDYLRKHKETEIVLILDCCRNQAGSRDFDNINDELLRGIDEISRTHGIITIFACDYGERSYELDNLKRGSFTYALVEGLKQNTSITQLESYLKEQIPKLNTKDGKPLQQNPRICVEPAHRASHPLLPILTFEKILKPISLSELGEIERNTQTLSDIIIACHQVENPLGSPLLEAVQENMKRGVRYTFLISKSNFLDKKITAYLKLFQVIAEVVQTSNEELIETEKLVRIKPLTIDWSYHPYIFYKTMKDQKKYEATTVYRGNEERRGICERYFPLETEVAPVVYNLLDLAVNWHGPGRDKIMSIEPKEFVDPEKFKEQFLPDKSSEEKLT